MKQTKRLLSAAAAAVLLISALAGCNRGVPEGYVPAGYVPEGYVPAGYISIEDARKLLTSLTLPTDYLSGSSEEITNAQGDEISSAIQEMEANFVAAEAPAVHTRDWNIYTSQFAKEGLSFEEAAFYDRLDEMCRQYIDSAALDGVRNSNNYITDGAVYSDLNLSKERAAAVALWFKYNNPQYYFIQSWICYTSDKLFFYLYDFAVDGEDRAKITNELFDKLDGWIDTLDGANTTWQKELAANNLLCKKIVYCDEYVTNKDLMGQTLYSAVMLESTVCAGYAQAFCAMMNASDVETAVVLSPTHAWNVVRFDDGKNYAVDATWNDNKNDDDNPYNEYLNVGEPTLKMGDGGAHTYSDKYADWSPELSQTDCDPSDYNKTGSGETKLSAPKNLHMTQDKESMVSLAWDAVSGASGYTVEVYSGEQTEKLLSTARTDPSVTLNYHTRTSLAVRVRAEADGSASEWTDMLVLKLNPTETSGSTEKTVKLDTPKNVKITLDEPTRTHFSWDAVDGVDQYHCVLFKDADHKETWLSGYVTNTTKGYKGLSPSTTYYYGVRAMKTVDGQDYYSDWNYFSHKTQADTSTSTAPEKPAAPKNVHMVSTGEDTTTTTWDAVPGATGYQIRLYKDSGYQEVWTEFSKTGTELKLVKMTKGTTYYFAVRTVKSADGKEAYSDWTKATHTHTGVTESDKLAAPANVKTVAVEEKKTKTTWDAVPGATGYLARLYKDAAYKEQWKEWTKDTNELYLSPMNEGRTYYFAVIAYKNTDSGTVYSDWVTETYTHTWSGSSSSAPTLAAPANFKAAATEEEGKARLTWDAVSGATGYEVCAYTDATYTETRRTDPASGTSMRRTGLIEDKTYYYGLRAVKAEEGKETIYSDWTNLSYTHKGAVASLAAPANLKIEPIDEEGKARASWDAVSGATGYQVCMYKDISYSETSAETTVEGTSVKLTKLNLGQSYYVAVRAVRSANGGSAYSEWTRMAYIHTAK